MVFHDHDSNDHFHLHLVELQQQQQQQQLHPCSASQIQALQHPAKLRPWVGYYAHALPLTSARQKKFLGSLYFWSPNTK